MESIICCDCGITFGAPGAWVEDRRKDHRDFWCPNGHKMHFGQVTEMDKLKKEIERLKESRDSWKDVADRRLLRVRAMKGQVTRVKNQMRQS